MGKKSISLRNWTRPKLRKITVLVSVGADPPIMPLRWSTKQVVIILFVQESYKLYICILVTVLSCGALREEAAGVGFVNCVRQP